MQVPSTKTMPRTGRARGTRRQDGRETLAARRWRSSSSGSSSGSDFISVCCSAVLTQASTWPWSGMVPGSPHSSSLPFAQLGAMQRNHPIWVLPAIVRPLTGHVSAREGSVAVASSDAPGIWGLGESRPFSRLSATWHARSSSFLPRISLYPPVRLQKRSQGGHPRRDLDSYSSVGGQSSSPAGQLAVPRNVRFGRSISCPVGQAPGLVVPRGVQKRMHRRHWLRLVQPTPLGRTRRVLQAKQPSHRPANATHPSSPHSTRQQVEGPLGPLREHRRNYQTQRFGRCAPFSDVTGARPARLKLHRRRGSWWIFFFSTSVNNLAERQMASQMRDGW